jgi:DNA-binding NtrC family response regulator
VEDLPALVEHLAGQICAQNGWKLATFGRAAIDALERYSWPGNIRELRNIVERLLLLADAEVDADAVRMALPAAPAALHSEHSGSRTNSEEPLSQRVFEFERQCVLAELERRQYQISETARALGLERSHLYKKCQQLKIDLNRVSGRKSATSE